MTRKPKTTSRTAKPETAKSQAAKSKTSEIAKPATRRSAAKQPPAPGADDGGEFASPACSAHEVDPAYMMAPTKSAPSKPAPGPVQEKPEVETAPPAPSTAAAPDATAAKAHAPNPSRVPFNQGPKPGWTDRHTKSPHNQGRGRMRVGRPHGRGQGG